MSRGLAPAQRMAVDGKFFRLGPAKYHPKGVAYGPFAPHDGTFFPPRAQVANDLRQIRELGANLLRVYYVPPQWFLDVAAEHALQVFVDVPWSKHLCFLDDRALRTEAVAAVLSAARACARHPAVFALSVVNEIPPDIVRWSGSEAIERFIDHLILCVKAIDPDLLCTFGNYPPTEFLRSQNADFVCFNVYLHQERAFENYLARLQMLADTRPLLLAEFGIDSIREGEHAQSAILSWQIEKTFRAGCAGAVIFSFTDDWFRNHQAITDWAFGLTRTDRQPKPAFASVREKFLLSPHFPLAEAPLVSVVVASYNGARTLQSCLVSLTALNYPAYEIILVDDGSTDTTPQIVAEFPSVRYLRQANLGLSAARNTGIEAARGRIVAFTDSDCRADRDWLYYLVGDLLKHRWAGIGGHNFLPPEDSWVAAAVMVSPGGPAHVMLTDRVAEHIPGCNMAFYKWALDEIGGFDPIFRKAGDDVDICWRLQQRGYEIGFSPGGFVWHYRRSTVRDYLKQQRGYGEAEALLVRKHPEYFNAIGGSLWQGRIYSSAKFGISLRPPMIYHGRFGSGFFQSLYATRPAAMLSFFTSLEYYVLVTVPLSVLAVAFGVLTPLAVTSVIFPLIVCMAAAAQAEIPPKKRRPGSRPLVALLHFLQPLVRGTARYQGRVQLSGAPQHVSARLETLSRRYTGRNFESLDYWTHHGVNRLYFIARIMEELDRQGWPNKADAGWNNFDIEVFGSRWSRLQLITASEYHAANCQRIRCRLRSGWSLTAIVLFWASFALALLVIGVLAPYFPALWALVLVVPGLTWFLQREGRDLQCVFALFLDQVAASLGFTKAEELSDPAPVPLPVAKESTTTPV